MALAHEQFFQRLNRLLDLEARAEAEQTRSRIEGLSAGDAERQGDCLAGLVVIDENSGLGGRCLVTFGKRNRSASLPWTRLQVGSPVLVLAENEPANAGRRGVICERRERHVKVAIAQPLDETDGVYRIVLASDEISRDRQRRIDRARGAAGSARGLRAVPAWRCRTGRPTC